MKKLIIRLMFLLVLTFSLVFVSFGVNKNAAQSGCSDCLAYCRANYQQCLSQAQSQCQGSSFQADCLRRAKNNCFSYYESCIDYTCSDCAAN